MMHAREDILKGPGKIPRPARLSQNGLRLLSMHSMAVILSSKGPGASSRRPMSE